MRRLERLLQKCRRLKEPGAGTAEEYNDTLRELGHHLLELYLQGKIRLDEGAVQIVTADDLLNIKGFIKETGKYLPSEKTGKAEKFTEAVAACLTDFYNIIVESNKGYHVSYYYYRGDNNPQGVPGALGDLILKLFHICYTFDIDIQSVLIEKYELYKSNHENAKTDF